MYVAAHENVCRGILAFMPSSLRKYMYRINFDEAYEIRMSIGKPLMLYYSDGTYYLNSTGFLTKSLKGAVKVTRAHIDEAIEIATKSSMYAKQDSIANGFITIDSGHRIGVCGTGVIKEDKVTFIKDISTLNYRLSCEVKGCADKLIDKIFNNNDIKNTLIIAPPGAGKTTLLRDAIRQISDKGLRVSVVDERDEIAALNDGRTCFDLGINTDVLASVPKDKGMMMVLRTMSPKVIATDEIGTYGDIKTIENIINCGVRIITTIHAYNEDDIKKRSELASLIGYFDVFAILSRDVNTSEFKMDIREHNTIFDVRGH